MTYLLKTYSIAVILFVVLLTACINDQEEDGDATTLIKVGDAVPEFTLIGSDGKEMSTTALKGQVYILNFFDTGCHDCQHEFQVLQRLYDDYHATIPVLNVPRSQAQNEIQTYWNHAGLTMPYHIPHDKDLYYRFATKTIPRTYIIDSNGIVAAAFDDSPTADYDTLVNLLQQALSKAEMVNLSMRVKVRGAGNGIEEYYFHNEYTISKLDIFVFNADTKQFFTKASVTGLTKEESKYDTQYDITYLFETIRIKAGVYDIFTIANYDYSPDDVENEADFLNLIDSITYKEGIEASMPDKGSVMTSRATALLGVDLVPWINKTYVLSVELERVMAKLQIGVSQNTFQLKYNGRKYADINITNYKLVNLNKRYYLFQHKDNLSDLGTQPQFSLTDNFGEYADQDDQYVVDPLFYQKTVSTTDDNRFNDYYKSWYGTFTTEDFASMPSANNHGYAYILENTTFKTCQKNGYSTGIVFKAAVNPTFVYLYDNNQRSLKEEYRPEYWPKTIYLYNYNFYGSIQAINATSGLTLDELASYNDAQLITYGIKQCKFNMGVYETFYTYWIHHRRNATDPMGSMQYGIVRNNFYKIVVTGISGIGNSSITPQTIRDNYPNSYADFTVN